MTIGIDSPRLQVLKRTDKFVPSKGIVSLMVVYPSGQYLGKKVGPNGIENNEVPIILSRKIEFLTARMRFMCLDA